MAIKRRTLRSWAHDIHHVKRAKRRRSRVRKYRERMEIPSLMLQMDYSPHRWFGDDKSCLIAIIEMLPVIFMPSSSDLKLPKAV